MSENANSKLLSDIATESGTGRERRRQRSSVLGTRKDSYEGKDLILTTTEITVDPADCKMWSEHDREYSLLTAKNTKDLISSIKSDGQHIAAVVRACSKEDDYKYEIVCGARRHFAVSHLRLENPDIGLRVRVYSINDEEAFRMSDAENRARTDISDYERAVKYQKALNLFYPNQRAMARALGETESWLSQYLLLAKMPTEVVKAFHSVHDIASTYPRQLNPFLANSKSKERLIASALNVQEMQSKAEKPLDGNSVVKLLVDGCKDKRKAPQAKTLEVKNSAGQKIMSVKKNSNGAITISIPGKGRAPAPELIEEFKKLLETS